MFRPGVSAGPGWYLGGTDLMGGLILESDPRNVAVIESAIASLTGSSASVVSDSLELLEALFHTGSHAEQVSSELCVVVVCDDAAPVDASSIIRRIRGSERFRSLPVIVTGAGAAIPGDDLVRHVPRPVDPGVLAYAFASLGLRTS